MPESPTADPVFTELDAAVEQLVIAEKQRPAFFNPAFERLVRLAEELGPDAVDQITFWNRFAAKVEFGPGCWNWKAALVNGYGSFYGIDRRSGGAHRYAYEWFNGPIPEGLHLDHLCRNRRCVNPAHLEPVTHLENIMRGESLPARNARKTHCPYGHPYDVENTYISVDPAGRSGRRCLTCQRANDAERWQRTKAGRS